MCAQSNNMIVHLLTNVLGSRRMTMNFELHRRTGWYYENDVNGNLAFKSFCEWERKVLRVFLDIDSTAPPLSQVSLLSNIHPLLSPKVFSLISNDKSSNGSHRLSNKTSSKSPPTMDDHVHACFSSEQVSTNARFHLLMHVAEDVHSAQKLDGRSQFWALYKYLKRSRLKRVTWLIESWKSEKQLLSAQDSQVMWCRPCDVDQ